MNLKPLVNNTILYEDFKLYIQAKLDGVHRGLEQSKSPEELYRLQGQAALLRKFLTLREEVNG